MAFLCRTHSFYCSKMNAPVHFESQCVIRFAWLLGLKVLRQTPQVSLHASILAPYPFANHRLKVRSNEGNLQFSIWCKYILYFTWVTGRMENPTFIACVVELL